MHILIVDDDRTINEVMKSFFESKGDTCSALDNSGQTLEWLENNSCDVVVLDISMPDPDGMSLIPLIRDKYPNLPILIFTALAYDSRMMEAALQSGANSYISKGMPPEEVYTALQRVHDSLK